MGAVTGPGVRAFQLARWAPLPEVVQLELVDGYGGELLLNPHLVPAAADALVDAVLDNRLHPLAAMGLGHGAVDRMLTSLSGREVVAPVVLEWLVSHRVFDTDGPHWDQVVSVLVALCSPVGPLRVPYGVRPAAVGARLVPRAPVRVRRDLVRHGSLMDRVRVLCLEYTEGVVGGAGGADRDDADFLAGGDLLLEPMPSTGSLLMLAALCRARPRLGVCLGERFVDLPDAAVRWSPQTVTLFAWTVPWRRAAGWRRSTPHSAVLEERLDEIPSVAARSAELEDQLAVLGMARAVPEELRDRAWSALSGRRTVRTSQLDCHEMLFGGAGHRLAAAALAGERGRRAGQLADALADHLRWPLGPTRAGGNDGPELGALRAVCGTDPGRWRLALALADGTLTQEQLADCILVSG